MDGEAISADRVSVEIEANVDGADRKVGQYADNFVNNMKRVGDSSTLASHEISQSTKDIEHNFRTLEERMKRLIELFALREATKFFVEALEGAAALNKLAAEAGVTTKALQELRFAGQQNGLTNREMDESLARLSDNLGKAKLGGVEVGRVFRDGLHLDPKQFKDASDAIGPIADALRGIPDPSKRAAIEMALFGRSGQQLDALLTQGAGGINKLRKEAEDLGIVLSQETINKAEDATRKFGELKDVLSADFSRVITDNAASIVALAQSLGKLTAEIINFLGSHPQLAAAIIGGLAGGAVAGPIGAAIGAVGGAALEQKSEDDSNDPAIRARAAHAAALQLRKANADNQAFIAHAGPITDPVTHKPGEIAELTAARAEAAKQAALLARSKGVTGGSTGKPTPGAQPDSNLFGDHKKGPDLVKQAEELTKKFNSELSQEQAQYLAALAKNTAGEEAKNKFLADQIDTERDKRLQEIKDQRLLNIHNGSSAKIEDDRAKQLSELEIQVAEEKKRTLLIQAQVEKLKVEDAIHDALLAAQQAGLTVQAALATNAKDRREVELRLLELAKEEERRKLSQLAAAHDGNEKTNPFFNPAVSDDQVAGAKAQLGTINQRYDAQKTGVILGTLSPLEQFRRDLPKSINDVNEALQKIEVGALDRFNQGLVDAVVNGKNFGQIMLQALKQVEAELLILALRFAESRLFGGSNSPYGLQQGVPTGLPVPGQGGGGILGTLLSIGTSVIGAIAGGGGGGGGLAGFGATGSAAAFGNSTVNSMVRLPMFASGGNVRGGQDIVIGENGPEIWRAPRSGTIMPNSRMRANQPQGPTYVVQQFTIDNRGGITTPELIDYVNQKARGEARTAGEDAFSRSVRAGPGEITRRQQLGTASKV